MENKEVSFEEALARLDAIVKSLEEGKTSLDESLKLFEEGIKLVRDCEIKLKNVEEKAAKILENGQEKDLGPLE